MVYMLATWTLNSKTRVQILVQQFFQYLLIIVVYYSWRIWLGRKPINEENKEKTEQQAKGNHGKQRIKTHQRRQLSQSKHP